MTSKEAFREARWIMEQYHKQFVKEGIELKTVEDYPLDKIEKDLEVLEILKKNVKIVDYGEKEIFGGELYILQGFRITNREDYWKIKEWLDNERL